MQASRVETVEVPRDRWGRPLIQVGDKKVPYARASSFGDVLDDMSNLAKWKTRMAVKGLALRPDLYLAASATPLENRAALNKLAEQAIEHAGGSSKANIGTALHAITEQIDRGEAVGPIPQEYADDLEAYRLGIEQFEIAHIERFMVCDELQVAGTPDRLIREVWASMDSSEYDIGPQRIGDLKTGGSADYLHKHAVQLAIYAHSDFYDPSTGEREAVDVAKDYGYIFHLPAGQGHFGLYKLDLEAGWQGALLAADVRKYRKRKGVCTPA